MRIVLVGLLLVISLIWIAGRIATGTFTLLPKSWQGRR